MPTGIMRFVTVGHGVQSVNGTWPGLFNKISVEVLCIYTFSISGDL